LKNQYGRLKILSHTALSLPHFASTKEKKVLVPYKNYRCRSIKVVVAIVAITFHLPLKKKS